MQFLNLKISAIRLICLICVSNTALAQTISYEATVVLPLDALIVEYSRENRDEYPVLQSLFTYQLDAPADDDELQPVFFDTWYRLAKADKLTCYIDAVMSNKTKVKWVVRDTFTIRSACGDSVVKTTLLQRAALLRVAYKYGLNFYAATSETGKPVSTNKFNTLHFSKTSVS